MATPKATELREKTLLESLGFGWGLPLGADTTGTSLGSRLEV
jgi:hypothetical protein